MKRETLIVIFYVLYFSWLFTVIYLSPETALLNVFTSGIVLFYFLFLRQEGDFVWFFATLVGAIFGRFISLENRRLSFDIQSTLKQKGKSPAARPMGEIDLQPGG